MRTKKRATDYQEPDPINWIGSYHKRQTFIYDNIPQCRKCNSKQVQIMKLDKPARWQCRVCKHRFEHEPGTSND